jgi:hypothetical protein
MADTKWFVQLQGRAVGPLASAQLRDLAAKGRITPHTPVSQDGKMWAVAARVRGLAFPRVALPAQSQQPDVGQLGGAGAAQGQRANREGGAATTKPAARCKWPGTRST